MIKKAIFVAFLLALANGCAYFTNIYERPKEFVEYEYYTRFYMLPVETTSKTIIMLPYVIFLSSTVEPLEKLTLPGFVRENPRKNFTGLFYLPVDFLVQLPVLSVRGVDLLLFKWWLRSFEPKYRKTKKAETYLKEIKERSPYIYTYL